MHRLLLTRRPAFRNFTTVVPRHPGDAPRSASAMLSTLVTAPKQFLPITGAAATHWAPWNERAFAIYEGPGKDRELWELAIKVQPLSSCKGEFHSCCQAELHFWSAGSAQPLTSSEIMCCFVARVEGCAGLPQVTRQGKILAEDAALAHRLGVVVHLKHRDPEHFTMWLENFQGDVLYNNQTRPYGLPVDPQHGVKALKV